MDFYFYCICLIFFQLVKGSGPPKNWNKFQSNSFYFEYFPKNYSFWEANQFCDEAYQSNLITITSEDNFIEWENQLSSSNITESWIGLTDFGKEGQFYWKSGYGKLNINNWGLNYPRDDRKAADCVLIRGTGDNYVLVDTHCAEKHGFTCMWMNKTDKQSNTLLPHQSHYTNQCPKPFFPVDGDCFWISPENLTWEDSRKICQNKMAESDLASILTHFQQDYFAALISGNSTAFWIGINFYNNKYQWILQQDVKYIKWGENEPNGAKKPCTYMSGNEHKLGEWYSANCTGKFKAICQTLIKNNSTASNDRTAVETDVNYDGILFQKRNCEKTGYTYYHGSCYRLISEKSVSFDIAKKLCRDEFFYNKTGHKFKVNLVRFNNAGEKYFILSNLRRSVTDMLNNSLWLGINGIKTENDSFLRIKISNYSKVLGFSYAPNSIKTLNHLCFQLLLNGIVHAKGCDNKSTAITMCKYRLNNFNVDELSSNNLVASCPKGWELFNSVCFYFDDHIYHSQYKAKMECMKLHSHLPSIDMQQQKFLNDFITKKFNNGLIDKNFKAWIGLDIFKSSYSNTNVQYKWNNEAPMAYINLKMSQFIHKESNQKNWCALFSSDNGLWDVVNCTNVKASLLCQKPANISKIFKITSTTQITSTTPATTTKTKTIKLGFQYNLTKSTWYGALEKCKSLTVSSEYTSNLAVFRQFSEILEIDKKFDYSQMKFWIGLSGLYDHFDNAFLRWSDNSSMVFQNFDYDNLMNLTGTENCVVMDLHTLKWLAVDCNEKLPFICKVSEKNNTNVNFKISNDIFENQNWPSARSCPGNYFENSNKCYHVVENETLNWKDADTYCNKLIPSKFRTTAWLASIDTTFENSFVYSLLSSNLYSNNDNRYWIGERYKNSNGDNQQLCAAMSGHPDPNVGARWFTEVCSQKMKFICSVNKIPIRSNENSISKCQHGFVEYENAMGSSCYYYDPHLQYFKNADHRCSFEKIPSHIVTMPSHYHMHFLRTFMENKGLSRDRQLWLGAQIKSSQIKYNWNWINNQPIRYTIWNKPPISNFDFKSSFNLCLYFIPEKDREGRLGMQLERCDNLTHRMYSVCEYTRNNDNNKDLAFGGKNKEINCLKDERGNSYEGPTNVAVDGTRCIRWDLLKPSETVSKIIHQVRNDDNKHKFIQYHSNECRYIKDMDRQTTFCAVETDSSNDNFMECSVQLCSKNESTNLVHEAEVTEHHSNTLTVVFVTLVLFLCIIVCIAMLSWRRWNQGALFGGYLRRSQFSFLNNNQSRGTSFNNPIYRPINT